MSIRKRHSIQELSSNVLLAPELEKVLKAFAGIQALPPTDPNSFYFLGGFHGEPFRGPVTQYPGSMDKPNVAQKLWWGGYCNHGNVLFPTWHRAYCRRFEKALQSIPGCSDVMLPFWDECFDMENWNPYTPSRETTRPVAPQVVPKILTEEYVMIDKKRQKNPLYSYTLQKNTSYTDDPEKVNQNYRFSKPKGYETCRFPQRGIVSNKDEKEITENWNAKYSNLSENSKILNENVVHWLEGTLQPFDDAPGGVKTGHTADTSSVYSRFQLCLEAPNYTVFSNTTSQKRWVSDHPDEDAIKRASVVSLESPHNSMHLAVGGFFVSGQYNANPKEYQLACGDMGDNETASFDPIFFLHHSFIDYVFWTWQKKHNLTKRGDLDILDDYPGTITDEGSPVGLAPGAMLEMSTPLYPFRSDDRKAWLTSYDMTDIHELGYDYGVGSLDPFVPDTRDRSFAAIGEESPKIRPPPPTFASIGRDDPNIDSDVVAFKRTSGINRAGVQGSFVIRTLATYRGKSIEVGREAILSRLNVQGCANCQTHLDAESQFPVYQSVVTALGAPSEAEIKYEIQLDTHNNMWEVTAGKPLSEATPILGLEHPKRLQSVGGIVPYVESI